jgi:hypothetical protein
MTQAWLTCIHNFDYIFISRHVFAYKIEVFKFSFLHLRQPTVTICLFSSSPFPVLDRLVFLTNYKAVCYILFLISGTYVYTFTRINLQCFFL